jgi:hypothetical protein
LIDVDATSTFNASAGSTGIFGTSSAKASLTADTIGKGIVGGAGDDYIDSLSTIDVDVFSRLTQSGTSFNFGGSNEAGGTVAASSTGTGIEGGTGDDYIGSRGSIYVYSYSRFTGDDGTTTIFGSGGTKAKLGADSTAIGISSDYGEDYIDNQAYISAIARSYLTQTSSSFTLGGSRGASGSVSADTTSIGITTGGNSDYVRNAGTIFSDAYSNLTTSGKSDAGFGSASATSASGAISTSIGIDSGSGDDEIENLSTITTKSWNYLGLSGSTFTFAGTGDASGKLSASATSVGIRSGSGHDVVVNNGNIDVWSRPRLYSTGSVKAALGTADTSTVANAKAVSKGIDAGSGNDAIGNFGQIKVDAETSVTSSDSSYAFGGATANEAMIEGLAYSIGIDGGTGNNTFYNDGEILVDVSATITNSGNSSATIAGGAKSAAYANVSAGAVGIYSSSGNDTLLNTGEISITGFADASSTHKADSGFIFGKGTSEAKTRGSIYGYGIDLSAGSDIISNEGDIKVNIYADVDAEARATGAKVWNGDATARAYTKAIATAVGIRALGYGDNIIENSGLIDVATKWDSNTTFADSYAYANGNGIDGDGRIVSDAETTAYAIGIDVGYGDNDILNTGTIKVEAAGLVEATGDVDGDAGGGEYETLNPVLSLNAYGIRTGSGNNTIINKGTIEADSMWFFTPYGIKTGNGNDVIVNEGTIDASQLFFIFELGNAIDSGGGPDIVALTDGSVTKGNVRLGFGNDILNLTGTPALTSGNVYGGSGNDTALLYGSGYFDGALLWEFESGLKAGSGTYTVPDLPELDILEVVEGRLVIDSDYQFSSNGTFVPHINPDGDCGVLQINGTAGLSGNLNVVAEHGVYLDGTEYGVLASDIVDGVFNNINLPGSAILTFSPEQDVDGLDVEVDVASFKTVADNATEEAIGGYLDRLTPIASGELYDAIAEFQWLPESGFDQAFASVSPEQYGESSKKYIETTRKSFDALQDRLDGIRKSIAFAPVVNGMDAAGNLAGFTDVSTKPFGLWYKGFIESFYEEQSGVTRLLVDTGNFNSFGYDTTFGKNIVAGFGRDHAEVTTTTEFTDGDGIVSGSKHFAYGSYMLDEFYVDLAFFYGDEAHSHRRELTVGALEGSTASEHDSESFSSYIETGKLLTFDSSILQPFGSLEHVHFKEEGFTESGGGPLALKIEDKECDMLVSNLGISAAKMWAVDGWTIMPEISLAWRYNIEPADCSTTASFVSAPGEHFVIDVKEDSTHALAIGASLDIAKYGKFRSVLDFSGELFTDENRYDVEWKLEYKF